MHLGQGQGSLQGPLEEPSVKLIIDRDKYPQQDPDTSLFLKKFEESEESKESLILEVGANDEFSADILAENGYSVMGIDLLAHKLRPIQKYPRIIGDFVYTCYQDLLPPCHFNVVYSLSAIEHFGLGTYGEEARDEGYDRRAMDCIRDRLVDGGLCYITVPYGEKHLTHGRDWRVYNRESLQERIIRDFEVLERLYFASGSVPGDPQDEEGIIPEGFADSYSGKPPHLAVFLKLRKKT